MSNEGCTTIEPGCDPCEAAEELLGDLLTKIFEEIEEIDENSAFLPFLEKMKPVLLKSLVKFMDELADCFTDKLAGVEGWMKKSLQKYHE